MLPGEVLHCASQLRGSFFEVHSNQKFLLLALPVRGDLLVDLPHQCSDAGITWLGGLKGILFLGKGHRLSQVVCPDYTYAACWDVFSSCLGYDALEAAFAGQDVCWWWLQREGFLGVGNEGLPVCLPEVDEGVDARVFHHLTLKEDQDSSVIRSQSCHHFPGVSHEQGLADQGDVGRGGHCCCDPGWRIFVEN